MVRLARWVFWGLMFAAVIGFSTWISNGGVVREAEAQTCPPSNNLSFDTSRSADAAAKVIPKMVVHTGGGVGCRRPGAVLRTVSLVPGRFEGQAHGLRGFRGPRGPQGPPGITPLPPVCVVE